MNKFTITGLAQAEDRGIDVSATMNGNPISDVADALFVMQDTDGQEQMRLRLGQGITFADSTFTVSMTDTHTANLIGKYNFELWFKDSLAIDVLVAHGTMKFNETFGRYN